MNANQELFICEFCGETFARNKGNPRKTNCNKPMCVLSKKLIKSNKTVSFDAIPCHCEKDEHDWNYYGQET